MWNQIEQSFWTHRKTVRLAKLLRIDRFSAAGRMGALLAWAIDCAPDGMIRKCDGDIIAELLLWDDADALMDALVTSGYLDAAESCYLIHDWDEYTGKLLDQRKANAARQKALRDRRREEADRPTGIDRNGYVRVTSRTRNATEKSREEKSNVVHREYVDKTLAPVAVAPTPVDAPVKVRSRDDIWDALVEVVGYSPVGKAEASKFGKAAKDLRDIGATADDIRTRGRNHETMLASGVISWTITPQSLVSNWGKLSRITSPPRRASTTAPASRPLPPIGPTPRVRLPSPPSP